MSSRSHNHLHNPQCHKEKHFQLQLCSSGLETAFLATSTDGEQLTSCGMAVSRSLMKAPRFSSLVSV